MSIQIGKFENTGKDNVDLSITQFCGPEGKRYMIQLTQGFGCCENILRSKEDEPGYIQLTERDAHLLIKELANWLKNNTKQKNFH